MYSFKIPFQAVFLATTFITAVLTAPVNVQRRDSTNVTSLTDAFASTITAVSFLNSDIQNISSSNDVGGLLLEFAVAATGVEMLSILMDMYGNLEADESQTVVNGSVLPLFAGLNKTADTLTQQANIITNLPPVDLSSLKASLGNMVSGISTLESAGAKGFFTPDAMQQLGPVSDEVNSAFNVVIDIYH